MGWVNDLLKDYPALSVAKERLALAEERSKDIEVKNEDLKKEVERLRAENEQLRKEVSELRSAERLKGADKLEQLLVHLFRNPNDSSRHIDAICHALKIEPEMVKYYLDKLDDRGLAVLSHGNYVTGHTYYCLTDKGRAYIVENGLLEK